MLPGMAGGLEVLPVSHNPWFLCALLLALRVCVVGWAWAWIAVDPGEEGAPWRRMLTRMGLVAVLGTAVNSLAVLVLAEIGFYSIPAELGVLAVGAAAGIALGLARNRPAISALVRPAGVTAAFCLVLGAVVMLLPHRGEWVAGGWDPGIYVGQGMQVSRTGAFASEPENYLLDINDRELALVTQPEHGNIVLLPVVPIDVETRSIQPFFFRLTPATFAWFDRCGGLRAATRAGLFLGGIASLAFLAALASFRVPARWCIASGILFAVHPISIFQFHFPTSEGLQAVLVAGLGILLPRRRRAAIGFGLIPLLLAAGVLNRFSFLPFAAVYLAACTWVDAGDEEDPARTRALGMGCIAIALACTFDFLCCEVSLRRLDELVPMLMVPAIVLLVLCLVLSLPGVRVPRALTSSAAPLIAGAALLALTLAIDLAVPSIKHLGTMANLGRVLPYLGAGPILLAAAGGLVFIAARGKHLSTDMAAWIGFLGLVSILTFAMAAIAPLVPWSLRRHSIYTLFLVATLGGAVISMIMALSIRHAKWAGVAILAIVLGSQARLLRDAWTQTDLDGLTEALADVNAQLAPDDIVIADHFRWGTPLRLIWNRPVINGEPFWREGAGDRWLNAQITLDRWEASGYRVLLLASTDAGAGRFGPDYADAVPIYGPRSVMLSDLIHRSEATGFVRRKRSKHFALYTWRLKQQHESP